MTMTRTLYRAADDDYLSDCASFAADQSDAEAYLDNPCFGGGRLWQITVEVDDEAVLDLRADEYEQQAERLADVCGIAVQELFIGQALSYPEVREALITAGYCWVRFDEDEDSSEGETWTWLGAGDEPVLSEVNR
jgi:hypothetical protein